MDEEEGEGEEEDEDKGEANDFVDDEEKNEGESVMFSLLLLSVSYTHLTLPTIRLV